MMVSAVRFNSGVHGKHEPMTDPELRNSLIEDLDAAFSRPEPATIDRSSVSAVVGSIRTSVLPAMHARRIRLVDALQTFNTRSSTPYEQAQQRLDFERVQVELLEALAAQLDEVAAYLSVADADELASICEGILAGATERSAVEGVRMLIRGKVAAGIITEAAGRLITAVVNAELELERRIGSMVHQIGHDLNEDEVPDPAALERVSKISDFHRDLSATVVQVEHVGASVDGEGVDQAILLVDAALRDGAYEPALAAIRAVIGRASSL